MKWEYDITDTLGLRDFQDIADRWGQGHWELVTVVLVPYARQQFLYQGFFKRRVDEAIEEPIDVHKPRRSN